MGDKNQSCFDMPIPTHPAVFHGVSTFSGPKQKVFETQPKEKLF